MSKPPENVRTCIHHISEPPSAHRNALQDPRADVCGGGLGKKHLFLQNRGSDLFCVAFALDRLESHSMAAEGPAHRDWMLPHVWLRPACIPQPVPRMRDCMRERSRAIRGFVSQGLIYFDPRCPRAARSAEMPLSRPYGSNFSIPYRHKYYEHKCNLLGYIVEGDVFLDVRKDAGAKPMGRNFLFLAGSNLTNANVEFLH